MNWSLRGSSGQGKLRWPGQTLSCLRYGTPTPVPPGLCFCGRRVPKRGNGLSSGRKLCSSSLLDARLLLPPCMPLVTFKLLTQCWSSEEVSLSKLCVGSLKGTAWTPAFFPPTQFPLFFTTRSYGDLIFLALEPWAGCPGVGLVLPVSEIFFMNFYLTVPYLQPSCQSGWMQFL